MVCVDTVQSPGDGYNFLVASTKFTRDDCLAREMCTLKYTTDCVYSGCDLSYPLERNRVIDFSVLIGYIQTDVVSHPLNLLITDVNLWIIVSSKYLPLVNSFKSRPPRIEPIPLPKWFTPTSDQRAIALNPRDDESYNSNSSNSQNKYILLLLWKKTKIFFLSNYELILRQQPKQSRMCGIGEKADRRPIDPPPIIQLKVYDSCLTQPENSSFLQNPYYFMYASLVAPDTDEELHLLRDGKTRSTTGSVVSSLYHLKDTDNSDAGFFVFPDLSVRMEGTYRLKLSLFEIIGYEIYHCKSIFSDVFIVYSAKRFPGMEESTFLSRSFADQGLKIRIRKEIRIRRLFGYPGYHRQIPWHERPDYLQDPHYPPYYDPYDRRYAYHHPYYYPPPPPHLPDASDHRQAMPGYYGTTPDSRVSSRSSTESSSTPRPYAYESTSPYPPPPPRWSHYHEHPKPRDINSDSSATSSYRPSGPMTSPHPHPMYSYPPPDYYGPYAHLPPPHLPSAIVNTGTPSAATASSPPSKTDNRSTGQPDSNSTGQQPHYYPLPPIPIRGHEYPFRHDMYGQHSRHEHNYQPPRHDVPTSHTSFPTSPVRVRSTVSLPPINIDERYSSVGSPGNNQSLTSIDKIRTRKILGLHASSKSIHEISRMIKIPKSTVQYTIACYSNSDNMKSASR
ncbi:5566_t:CDS:10, partial [Entrophospora sp. SA101]